MARKKPQAKNIPSALDALTQEAERCYAQSDGRVIERNLGVLQFELQAQEDHLAGLKASIVDVQGRAARTKARIEGLTRVMARR